MSNTSFNLNILKKHKIAAAVTLAALTSTPALAEDLHDDSGITLTPSVGFHSHSDRKQGVEDSGTVSLGAGYQFKSPWAAELTYLASKPEQNFTGTELDEQHLRLDAIYYLDRTTKTQPYIVFGGGVNEFDRLGAKDDGTLLNLGMGVKYAFNNVVALRTDMRVNQYLDTKTTQLGVNVGLSFLLGSSPSKKIVKTKDSDNDGVNDRYDNCPNTALGIKVDATGCAVPMDQDKDGIVDSKDACPDTKPGAKVTADGCYVVLTENRTVSLKVQFANNADTILNPNDPQISELVTFMREYPTTNVVIEGHTDDRGSAAYNQKLSLKRAQAVANLLVQQENISEDRVSAQGLGEANPIADNSTAEGRAENRRVEAVVSAMVETTVQ